MVSKSKQSNKEIVVEDEHFIPVEPSEPILPLNELGSRLGKADNEKWTGCKVVADKETGEKVLLVRGIKNKEKDRSKRMVKKGGEFDPENIVSGTRRRKNINYKENTERKESRKTNSKNTHENRSKTVAKTSKKKSTSKKRKAKEEEHSEEEEEHDKENIENQQEDEEIVQAPKRTRKNRKNASVKKEEPKEEEPKEPEWTLPLSPVVCQLIQKLGGELPTEAKKRCYKGIRLSEPVNYWCAVKWPEDTLYVMDPAKTNGETVGLFKHELFELTEIEQIQYVQDNPNAVMLADGEGLLTCLPDESNDPDFNVHIILEATEGADECVFRMKLSEYLASLSVDPRKVEN